MSAIVVPIRKLGDEFHDTIAIRSENLKKSVEHNMEVGYHSECSCFVYLKLLIRGYHLLSCECGFRHKIPREVINLGDILYYLQAETKEYDDLLELMKKLCFSK